MYKQELEQAKRSLDWLYSIGLISDEAYYDVRHNICFALGEEE
ncbi:TPA: hypothetical protein ACSVZR_003506 [Bacillus cereus]